MSAVKDVDQLLEDLDSFAPSPSPGPHGKNKAVEGANPGDVLEFLDDITKTSEVKVLSNPSRPLSRGATERVSLSSLKAKAPEAPPSAPLDVPSTASGSVSPPAWTGWGSVWSSASAAIQQAKTVVDEGVKNLPNVPQREQWREGIIDYVKSAQLEKLGQDLKTTSLSRFTDIINVLAPPITEHEVIQVWLSYDMEGYEGVETVIYRAFARTLEQVEGGDLVVNKGNESRPKSNPAVRTERNLNTVNGFEEAVKLANADIDALISGSPETGPQSKSIDNPTVYSQVYLRIQPYTSTSPFSPPASAETSEDSSPPVQSLQFLLHLRDPSHSLAQSTVTQAIPSNWMDLYNDHDWVEEMLGEVLRLGVEVLSQEYIVARMGYFKSPESTPQTIE